MPSNIIKLLPSPSGNYGNVQLGTVKNDGTKVFSDSVIVLQAGLPPMPNLTLPDVLPPMDEPWGTITITVIGCKVSPNGMLPVPVVGIPALPWPPWVPPPPSPPPPPIPYIGGVPGWLSFPPFTVIAPPPVTILASVRTVGLPIPGTPDLSIPAGVLDCMSMPGAMYEFQFSVQPFPGFKGSKKYEFPLKSMGLTVATIGVGAVLIGPDHPDSE